MQFALFSVYAFLNIALLIISIAPVFLLSFVFLTI